MNAVTSPTPPVARPWCKYPGGKTQLLPELRKHEPVEFKRYHELFVGGGALFWDLAARGRIERGATLADWNPAVVMAYRAIRDQVEALIDRLHEHEKAYKATSDDGQRLDYYLKVRGEMGWPGHMGPDVDEAARLIFTNKTGYNGMLRVNGAGKFNVPHGKYKNPGICDDDNLRACARALDGIDVVYAGFTATMRHARPGDFMYLDPPYVPINASADFTGYTAGGFKMAAQEELRDLALECRARGVHVVLSNADLPVVRELYKDFTIHSVQAKRHVNRDATKRGFVGEVIIT